MTKGEQPMPSYKYPKEEIEKLFPIIINDFIQIDAYGITDSDLQIEEYEDGEIQKVVVYCNQDCSLVCGIVIKRTKNKLQYELVKFENIGLLILNTVPIDVSQILHWNWCYENYHTLEAVPLDNFNLANKMLLNLLKNYNKIKCSWDLCKYCINVNTNLDGTCIHPNGIDHMLKTKQLKLENNCMTNCKLYSSYK